MDYKKELSWIDDCIASEYLAIEQINKSIEKLTERKGELVKQVLFEKLQAKVVA